LSASSGLKLAGGAADMADILWDNVGRLS